MSSTKTALKILLPLLVLAAGFIVMKVLSEQRKAPEQKVRENRGVLVETVRVEPAPFPVEVLASGTVQPRLRSQLAPQVAGRVVAVSPRLVEGGFFRKGEELFRLEAVDFQLAVQQAEASLAEAERNLLTVQSQAKVARQEWDALNGEGTTEPNPLVLFKPQLAEAEARLASGKAALEQTRLNLQRTRVRAPFNGRVVEESLDAGQFLRAGDGVVTLVGTDEVEIVLPVPLTELRWLKVPRPQSDQTGSPVAIRLPGGAPQWEGTISRSLAVVDARGRMPRLAVTVRDPFNLQGSGERPDLTLGLFVEAILMGPTLQQQVQVPRAALRENNSVWLMDEGKLRIQPVEVLRVQQDRALLKAGLSGGEELIVSPLTGAANGMKLRTRQGR